MIKDIAILLIVLAVIGFGIQYISIEPRIKQLIIGIIIFVAVIFVVIMLLTLLGVTSFPRIT